ncbi:MAG: MotA/TolQ/ExbB proton channel family protein [Oscillospiraceae bacterium]|nr:MotA/TolQ/ExbB proton channel family protein [Oscillospiraceae bacterium]
MDFGFWATVDFWGIFVIAGIAVGLLIWAKTSAKEIDHTLSNNVRPNAAGLKKQLKHLSTVYTVLLALISIFPLLGMLGTVLALLNLDITDTGEALQNDFFAALNTTAAGLFCAILFKILNAFHQPSIEMQEERAAQYLEKHDF